MLISFMQPMENVLCREREDVCTLGACWYTIPHVRHMRVSQVRSAVAQWARQMRVCACTCMSKECYVSRV
jgi:hypothetical protein